MDEIKKLKYLNIIEATNLPILEIADIAEYIELIKRYNPQIIFVKKGSKKKKRGYYDESEEELESYFLFYADGIGFIIKNKGYESIPDMINGSSKGFSEGAEYYDAMKKGFVNYNEYKTAISLGYKNKEDYSQSETLGFRGSLDKINKIKFKFDDYGYVRKVKSVLYNFKKEADVYYYAVTNGFNNFEDLKDGLSKLFLMGKDYYDALKKGFSNGAEYEKAKTMGFDDPAEFREALKLKIKTKEEYETYLSLLKIKKNYDLKTMEEALLFNILLSLKPKKKLSAEKIWEKLKSEEKKFEVDDGWYGKRLPDWFDESFEDKEELKKYLSKSEKIQRIGIYDKDGEVFERKPNLSPRVVIVDGSNVAWGSGSRDRGDRPHAKNIKLVVDALKEKGFSEILVIIDPSLNHQVDDPEILLELAKEGILKEAPAKRDADEFILKYVKEYKAYVVTNDTFKDWKEKDDWVKENIEKYRVSFMMDGDVVKFDEKIEKIGE